MHALANMTVVDLAQLVHARVTRAPRRRRRQRSSLVRGIEVGHIFKLGTKYSEALDARFADEEGALRPFWMGCYGIGISRVAAAAIEQRHDASGMIWPLGIAPHSVLLIQMAVGDPDQDELARDLYDELRAAGVDVLWDERPRVRPGVRFKDADLVGIPLRIVVGRDAAERKVEWALREGGDKESIGADDAVARAVELCREAGR